MKRAAEVEGAQQPWPPRVLARDADHLVFTQDRVFAMVWVGDTRVDAVAQSLRLAAEFAAGLTPPRFCLLTVVEQEASLPSTPARTGLARLLQRNSAHLIGSAVAFEGSGFRAAAVRGVATSIALLSRHEFPHRVFSGTDAALSWLGEGIARERGAGPSGDELARALQHMRSPTRSGAQRRG
jgi:hypothetical protein